MQGWNPGVLKCGLVSHVSRGQSAHSGIKDDRLPDGLAMKKLTANEEPNVLSDKEPNPLQETWV